MQKQFRKFKDVINKELVAVMETAKATLIKKINFMWTLTELDMKLIALDVETNDSIKSLKNAVTKNELLYWTAVVTMHHAFAIVPPQWNRHVEPLWRIAEWNGHTE